MTARPARARVLIVDDDPGVLRAAARVLGTHHEVAEAAGPREALEKAAAARPDVAVCDVRMPDMDGFALMQELRRRVPDIDVILMTGSHTEPDANLVRAVRHGAFYFIEKPFHRDVLETLVDRCLEMRRLREAGAAHLRRLEGELAEARVFQQTMLAAPQADIGPVSIAARWRACSELGGDFYDYGDLGDGRVAFIVADVRGHGASAALLTATVKAAFRNGPGAAFEPGSVARQLSEWLAAFGQDRFVTLFCAVLDPRERSLRYLNAGHPAALLRGPGAEPSTLAATGPLVSSLFGPGSWRTETTGLPDRGELIIYTDGVHDPGPGGARYRLESLMARVRSPVRSGALLDTILADIDAHAAGRPLGDDVTLMSVAWA